VKPLAWLLGLLVLVAIPLGPGREATTYAHWWLTNNEPPDLTLLGPVEAVRGTIEVPVETRPRGRVDLEGAEVDGLVELDPESSLRINTTALPDGQHVLTVRAQDRSLRRNAARASFHFSTDNTPPAFEIQSRPKSVPQGHTLVVQIYPSEPAEVSATLEGAPINLFQRGSEYWAVVGFDPEEKPGPRPIVAEGRDRVGNSAQSEQQVVVEAFEFTRDQLRVPSSMLPLLEPAVRAAEDERLQAVYRQANGPPLWRGPFVLPVLGQVTTHFGEFRVYNEGPVQGRHNGTDFQAAAGAPVQASARGRVVLREEVRLRGRILILDHGAGIYTTYAHLSEWLVEPDQEVQQRQPIAKVGSSGLSTGPHLHWELWVNGKPVNPVEWTEREVP
jgi:murein DD-endopeptidase MepM/ murein hydrolase activator NlpD